MNEGKIKLIVKRSEKQLNMALTRYQIKYDIKHLSCGVELGTVQGSYNLFWVMVRILQKKGNEDLPFEND